MMLWTRLRKSILVAGLIGLSSAANAAIDGNAGLDLSLSNDTANVGLYSLRETPQELTNLGIDFMFNNDSDRVLDVFGSIARKGLMGNQNLELGLKGKVFYLDEDKDSNNGYGLMLGALGRYWLPTAVPSAIAAEYLYAPSIVTFGDADNAYEFNVRAEMRILPSAVAYIGFRQFQVKFPKTGDHEVDGNAHIGVRIAFY